jgi:hypothetical protein
MESVLEDLHRIMSTHVTIILQNIDCYHDYTIRLREALQFLMTPVGPDLSVTSPDRSTDPMQCLESLDSVCEDLHRILSHHVIRILQNRICNTFRSRRFLPSLVTPVGPDMRAESQIRSHAVP